MWSHNISGLGPTKNSTEWNTRFCWKRTCTKRKNERVLGLEKRACLCQCQRELQRWRHSVLWLTLFLIRHKEIIVPLRQTDFGVSRWHARESKHLINCDLPVKLLDLKCMFLFHNINCWQLVYFKEELKRRRKKTFPFFKTNLSPFLL